MHYQLLLKKIIVITATIFYCEIILAANPDVVAPSTETKPKAQTVFPEKSCDAIENHIGFDAIGLGFKMDLKKNGKKLEDVSITINNGKDPFNEGIPLPCVPLLEVSNAGKGDVFDLKLNKCSEIPKTIVQKGQKILSNIFSSDPNSKSDLKFYSFNPNDKHNFLKQDNLKSLYGADGKLIANNDAKIINKLLEENGTSCVLRDVSVNSNPLNTFANYIECSDVGEGDKEKAKDVKKYLEGKLKDTCAVSYRSGAVGEIYTYSTANKGTEANVNVLKECVKKFSNLDPSLKEHELTLKFDKNTSPELVNKDDEFKVYDSECSAVKVSSVVADLNTIVVMSDVAKYYSEDVSTCVDCQGVKLLSDKQIGFFSALSEINDVCKTDLSDFKNSVEKACGDKKLSCSKFENAECALELELDTKSNKLNLSSLSSIKDGYNQYVNREYVSKIHQIFKLMSDVGNGGQNRTLADSEIPQLVATVDKLRACVADKQKIEYLAIASPQPAGKYLYENLMELSKLVDKLKPINSTTTASGLKDLVKKDLLKVFDTYGTKTKELTGLSEEKLIAKDFKSNDCGSLARILSNVNKCELSEQGMKASGKAIETALEDYEDDKTEILDAYKEQIAEKTEEKTDTTVKKMERYLKLLDGDFSSKTKKDEMVELLVLNDELSGKTKDLKMEDCPEGSDLDESKIASVFGKNGKKLKDSDITGKSGIASDDELSLREEIEALKNENAVAMQNLNAALAQTQGGGSAGMNALKDAMLGGFSTYANTLAGIQQNTSDSLITGFNNFGSILQTQSREYTQALGQQNLSFYQSMYGGNNTSANALGYSQAMYNQTSYQPAY